MMSFEIDVLFLLTEECRVALRRRRRRRRKY